MLTYKTSPTYHGLCHRLDPDLNVFFCGHHRYPNDDALTFQQQFLVVTI